VAIHASAGADLKGRKLTDVVEGEGPPIGLILCTEKVRVSIDFISALFIINGPPWERVLK